jgi:hypothetical protein
MSVISFFILTYAQSAHAMSLDDKANARIEPRAVSNASPGVGINMNDQAAGVAAGATVMLGGQYVAPKRIVDDPSYQKYCPDLIAFLLTLPFCSLETDTIFGVAPFIDDNGATNVIDDKSVTAFVDDNDITTA